MVERDDPSLLERYRRLAEISRDLASTVDLPVLLNRITLAAADLSNAEAASILLYDESKQQLFFEASSNLEEPLMRGLVVPVEGSIAGWIVSQGQPVIISDTQNDPRHFGQIGKITNVTTTSLLGVPLIAKENVIGALEAINKRAGQFTEEDREILMDLAAQAAVAIENARLFQQSDLIAEMVHELRTPLASLRTASHLLLNKGISDEQGKKVAVIIDKETNRLITMTTAFLDLARLESGRTPFYSELFDVGALIRDCYTLMQARAEEKQITLITTIPSDLPAVRGDRDKIKQVLLNLLSNAINYNQPNGTISVGVEARGNEIALYVKDTGKGIRKADLAHLFDKFYRAQSTEKAAQGTGLGLAICKRIIEAHHGRIEVESEIGAGTTFWVFLPLKGS